MAQEYEKIVKDALFSVAPDLEGEEIVPDETFRDQFEIDSIDFLIVSHMILLFARDAVENIKIEMISVNLFNIILFSLMVIMLQTVCRKQLSNILKS